MIFEERSILPIQCVNTQGKPRRGIDLGRSKHSNIWRAEHLVNIMNLDTRNNKAILKIACLERLKVRTTEINTGTGPEKETGHILSSMGISNTNILSAVDMNSRDTTGLPLNALTVMVETAQRNLSNLTV